MVVVSRRIHIEAPVARVFALMADPCARSRLNPQAQAIRVEIESGGPLRLGSLCRFRLQFGDRIVDYRTRITGFVPERCVVSLSDSPVPFETSIETEPEEGGTRLTQTESFEPSEAMLAAEESESATGGFLGLVNRIYLWTDPDSVLQRRQQLEKRIQQRLERNLERWLAAIREHLEAGKDPAC